jgi:hypothetical protein
MLLPHNLNIDSCQYYFLPAIFNAGMYLVILLASGEDLIHFMAMVCSYNFEWFELLYLICLWLLSFANHVGYSSERACCSSGYF